MKTIKTREVPEISDTLGETLYALKLNGLIYAQSTFTAPWSVDMPAMPAKMMFHIVTQGDCCLRSSEHEDIYLAKGDMVLLPQGEGHRISSDMSLKATPFFDIPVTQMSDRFELIDYGGGGEQTLLTCGVLSFDHLAGQKLISQLPPVIHIKGGNTPLTKSLNLVVQMMAEEVSTLEAGGETIVAHLADIIVIKAIRHWIEHAPEASQGWLGGLKDPKIGKALSLIHAHPESAWTLERLASQAGMSRSGFSARFTEVVGTSAKQYLTEWRMGLARIKIMQSPVSLLELSEALGYTSEAAFSRAYKRVFGEPPLRQTRSKVAKI